MSSTKQEVLFKLHAIAFDADALAQLEEKVQKEVERFRAGKRTKTNTTDLESMLDSVAEVVGRDEATRRIDLRTALDDITRTGPSGDPDWVKQYGKDVVRTWLAEREIKTTTKTSAKRLNKAVQDRKYSTWEDEPEYEENALRQQEYEEAAKAEERKKAEEQRRAEAARSSGNAKAKVNRLTITEDVPVTMTSNGETYEGTLHPDGGLTFEGTRYNSVSSAALAAIRKTNPACSGATGWRRWFFMQDGKKVLIDSLRENSKGYKRGEGRRSSKLRGVEACKAEITRLEARVARLSKSVKKASTDLATAREALTEAEKREAEGSGEAPPVPSTPKETPKGKPDRSREETAASVKRGQAFLQEFDEDPREAELRAMKLAQLREVAKALKIKGRSKLNQAKLVQAILAAEAA